MFLASVSILCLTLVFSPACSQPDPINPPDIWQEITPARAELWKSGKEEAEKTVNMRVNETSYPHRKVVSVKSLRLKQIIDTSVQEAVVEVAETNCTVNDRFDYRQRVQDYEDCSVIPVRKRETICHDR